MKATDKLEPLFFKPSELATRWRLHTMTIIRMLHSKQIYGFKIGEKSWRIPISAVHEYEEKGGSK